MTNPVKRRRPRRPLSSRRWLVARGHRGQSPSRGPLSRDPAGEIPGLVRRPGPCPDGRWTLPDYLGHRLVRPPTARASDRSDTAPDFHLPTDREVTYRLGRCTDAPLIVGGPTFAALLPLTTRFGIDLVLSYWYTTPHADGVAAPGGAPKSARGAIAGRSRPGTPRHMSAWARSSSCRRTRGKKGFRLLALATVTASSVQARIRVRLSLCAPSHHHLAGPRDRAEALVP